MDSVRYVPDAAGMRELGVSAGAQDVTLRAGGRIASAARQIYPSTTYTVRPGRVAAGWDNELRAGAIVTDETGEGGRKRSLRRGIEAAKR